MFRAMLIALTMTLGLSSAQLAANIAPRGHGLEQTYEILRNGTPIGSHRVRIESDGGQTIVTAVSEMRVRFLGIPVYQFRYESREVWDQTGLLQLQARVDDDGERKALEGHRQGQLFTWTVNDTDRYSSPLPLFPTNHWNPNMLRQERVLNTLTGHINRVNIEKLTAQSSGLSLPDIDMYRYSGDLNIESWYDAQGRWLGMRFAGRDGSTIEYRCTRCGADQSL